VTSTGMTECGATARQTLAKTPPLANPPPIPHLSRHERLRLHLASKRNGTLYTGVTSDLPGRLFEHQNELTKGFTSRYGVKTLVWFEEHDLVTTAITREKTIKKWPRQWKLNLIEAMNPDWEDIAHYLHGL
jgi:putative endonuclease